MSESSQYCSTDQDGNLIRSIKIGKQEWMSENLNVQSYQNGDAIFYAPDKRDWEMAGLEKMPAWCFYNNDPANGACGKLYNYWAIRDIKGGRNIAPKGWEVADQFDWHLLAESLGTKQYRDEFDNVFTYPGAGRKLKSPLWPGKSAHNESVGFNAHPSCALDAAGNFFGSNYTHFYTRHSGDPFDFVWVFSLHFDNDDLGEMGCELGALNFGHSIRCVKKK